MRKDEDILKSKKGGQHFRMVVDTCASMVRFDTKEGEGGWRDLSCVKLTAQTQSAIPKASQPDEIMRLADDYPEDEDDSEEGNYEAHDVAGACPSELLDAAMGAAPAPVPEDLPQDDEERMEEEFEVDAKVQGSPDADAEWEDVVEVREAAQTMESAGDELPPGARLSKHESIKMWRVYFKRGKYIVRVGK